MNKFGIVVIFIALVLIFSAQSVAPDWFLNSQLGTLVFTILVVLSLIALLVLVK